MNKQRAKTKKLTAEKVQTPPMPDEPEATGTPEPTSVLTDGFIRPPSSDPKT